MNRLIKTTTKLLKNKNVAALNNDWLRSVSSMQSLNFNETHIMLKNTVKEFVDKEVLPRASQIDKKSEYPDDIIKKMGDLGLMGISVPEEYNGTGLDTISYVLTMEEISRGCASCGVIMSANNVISTLN
jgi:alkylation response protein AidB-like acyl-CoA dehydrogenase